MRPSLRLFAVLVLGIIPPAMSAQTRDALQAGARVRIVPVSGKTIESLAANGEANEKTFPWTSPSPSAMHWLSATTSGHTVTMRFRYDPPPANAPSLPSDKFYVTSRYGLNQLVQVADQGGKPALAAVSQCWTISGCSFVVDRVPSGTHVFTVTASWNWPGITSTISADTTVVVP